MFIFCQGEGLHKTVGHEDEGGSDFGEYGQFFKHLFFRKLIYNLYAIKAK